MQRLRDWQADRAEPGDSHLERHVLVLSQS
jgi:hypothetical protein